MQIKSQFTDNSIDFEYFINLIPEVTVLKTIIENNAAHKNESVYDHTRVVFENAKLLVKKYGFSNINKNIFLLYLSIILHDLGKKDTIIRSNNITTCDGHEDRSEKIIKSSDILERFNLSTEDKIWILKFIKNHVKIHKTLDKDDQYFESSIKDLKSEFPDMFVEYLIFGVADIKDSYFKEFNSKEYTRRIDLLEIEIAKYNYK